MDRAQAFQASFLSVTLARPGACARPQPGPHAGDLTFANLVCSSVVAMYGLERLVQVVG